MQPNKRQRVTKRGWWRPVVAALLAVLAITMVVPTADAEEAAGGKRKADVPVKPVPVPAPDLTHKDLTINIHKACRTALGGSQISAAYESAGGMWIRVQVGPTHETGWMNPGVGYTTRADGLESGSLHDIRFWEKPDLSLIYETVEEALYCPAPEHFDYATSCSGPNARWSAKVFNDSTEIRTYEIGATTYNGPIELEVAPDRWGSVTRAFGSAQDVHITASYEFKGEHGAESDTFAQVGLERPFCDDGAVTVASADIVCHGLLPLARVIVQNTSDELVKGLEVTFAPEYSLNETVDFSLAANSSWVFEQQDHSVYETVQITVTREGVDLYSEGIYMACPQ